jgi:hypothetical protein
MTLEKTLYTAKAHTTGGREGGSYQVYPYSNATRGNVDVTITVA